MEDEETKWNVAVGAFISSFGNIEYVTYLLWDRFLSDKSIPNNFKDRVDKLIGAIRSEPAAETIGHLIKARSLADTRNTIAHNPMMVQLWLNKHNHEYSTELAIRSYIDENEYYTLDQVDEICDQAKELSGDLLSCYMDLIRGLDA